MTQLDRAQIRRTERRLHRTEAALHERETSFIALARIAPVGIMRFDASGRCNYVNDRWTAITGLTIDEAIGDGWQRVVYPDDRAAVCEHWRQLRDADELFLEEYRICRRDGAVRWVLAEGVGLRAYSGESLGFIRALTDISTHRQLEAELKTIRAELEERVRLRTADLEAEMQAREKLEKQILEIREDERRRFSHDLHDGLGQSLTGILFHTLALQRDLEREYSTHTGKASKIGELVNNAINQAHNIARGVQPVPVRPDGLFCALQELAERLRQSKVADCVFHCAKPVHVPDHDIATHLYRIAQEAVTNAIKHSGKRKVTLRLEPDLLLVRDDGRGFPEEAIPGPGRGLNIMRHRARLIGATLKIRSTPGSGTTIECIFPPPSESEIHI
ncbi:MAG TPA: PAS domain-containing sensor histidine kinase [Chthoniobacterales bacterium]|jgi:PAS domain S-box-containing protein